MDSARISDLVEDFKLETEFHPEHTIEITQHERGPRLVKVKTKWTQEHLGYGTFSEVWLEKNESGATRAVKCVSKTACANLNFHKELIAMAKLRKVGDAPHMFTRYAKSNSTKICLSSSTVRFVCDLV